MQSNLVFTESIRDSLLKLSADLKPDRIFILTETNVLQAARMFEPPMVDEGEWSIIVVPSGEQHKNLETLSYIWTQLAGASRKSLLCCFGGGMISDIGGFAASTFKRGIRHINIPTSLLAVCDASIGGKTGIDFNGAKNEIGAFAMPEAVIISPAPLTTLPKNEILSGLGEMIKTALIADKDLYVQLLSDENITGNLKALYEAAAKCASIKCRIVAQDPNERNLRKVLNFGHTAGHALESLMLKRQIPVSHGVAVAHGILIALILSHTHNNLPSELIYSYAENFLRPLYHPLPFTCEDYPELLRLMSRDKKNIAGADPMFVLLSDIGKPVTDIPIPPEEITTALDITRDLLF